MFFYMKNFLTEVLRIHHDLLKKLKCVENRFHVHLHHNLKPPMKC